MSEITWAAIVGASGALIGSGIAGLISYFISRLQTDARNNELERQLKHQEGEARRNRLIKTRESYLIPLREIASKLVVAISQMIDETEYFGLDIQAKAPVYIPRGFWESHIQALENLEGQVKSLKEDLEPARGQVHDKKLNESLDKIVVLKDLPVNVGYTLKLLNRRKIDVKRIDELLKLVKMTSNELRSELQQINHRIEELLVGDE
jgi:hypothetical protein